MAVRKLRRDTAPSTSAARIVSACCIRSNAEKRQHFLNLGLAPIQLLDTAPLHMMRYARRLALPGGRLANVFSIHAEDSMTHRSRALVRRSSPGLKT